MLRRRLVAMLRRRLEQSVSIADSVSSRPPEAAYVWGSHPSILSTAILHTFYVLRVISPLQWIKYWYRLATKARSTTQPRPDVPPIVPEIYWLANILVLLLLLALQHLTPFPSPASLAIRAFALFIAVEGSVWILYYLIVRSFIERRYTIYHPAEYILLLPVVLLDQSLAWSLLLSAPTLYVMTKLAGVGPVVSWQDGILVGFGRVYLGVAISTLLSSFPGIRARESSSLAIVGAGQVTSTRILPALSRLGYRKRGVVILTTDPADAANLKPLGDWRVITSTQNGIAEWLGRE